MPTLCYKYVPTDMEWSPNFDGDLVYVSLYETTDSLGVHHNVCISGNDDTHVNRWFDNDFEGALALYNSIRYLQSYADLRAFEPGNPGADSNGWPHERPISEPPYPGTW